MRKFVAVSCTTLGLLFGGAGVAHATSTPDLHNAPAVTSTLAADENTNDNSGDNGLWGLTGLLGLLGLIGLRRRNDARPGVAATPAVGGGTTPRA